jgi:pyruvate dehydrogenase E2 component (dihydrolipoamide acetyltransferase)
MAREVGVAIERLPGTGPAGRIVSRDVEAFVKASVGAASGAPAVADRTVGTGGARDVPLTAMRRTIARRLTESVRDAPVFFATTKVGADQLLQLREQLNRVTDARVSINDIIVKACALALKSCPQINATFHGDRLRLHEVVDIAVAVAVEGGLITPVVRNADRKDVRAIGTEIKDLAERARLGKLAPEEYQGGTFTISNLGMYGVTEFTAIINPPQCAILAVGAIDCEVYLEAGVVRERRIVKVTLGADHRAIDGAMSARFLADLRAILENPAPVLL